MGVAFIGEIVLVAVVLEGRQGASDVDVVFEGFQGPSDVDVVFEGFQGAFNWVHMVPTPPSSRLAVRLHCCTNIIILQMKILFISNVLFICGFFFSFHCSI